MSTSKQPPHSTVPVITLDGPSGSGKGTVSRIVASKLGWNFLDSGALYRVVAFAAWRCAITPDDEGALERLARDLDLRFESEEGGASARIFLAEEEVTNAIRSEKCGVLASRVASLPAVRRMLLGRQRGFRKPPGLVADGRDMGSVVFPDARLKIFLIASQEERARRRYKQLKDKGMDVNLSNLLRDIGERDARDKGRHVAPMEPAPDAVTLDTTNMGIDEVVESILNMWRAV